MAALAIRCKRCGILVPVGIRTGWVARPVIGVRDVACPECGIAASYHGADFLAVG
ncbi:MAG TPA: hypothetical protein VGR28_04530 [Candidatus Thermoplasmatota archaeon]|nr:hypothetical protein [Candidatus Thermoplasmatota archaeon]